MNVKTKTAPLWRLLVVLLLLLTTACAHQRLTQYPYLVSEPLPKPPHFQKPIQVALVLGAGGARSLAHLGVLEVLEEAKIPIDLIVGCSAGSVIGALYADNPHAKHLAPCLLNMKRSDLLDPSLVSMFQGIVRLQGPIQGHAFERFLSQRLKAAYFEQLKIPFVAVATSLTNNQLVLFGRGLIVPAVHASAAMPPFFTPVSIYRDVFVDGGVIAPVPVQAARQFQPKVVIAVDVATAPPILRVRNQWDVINRSLHISYFELSKLQSNAADVTVRPLLPGFGTFDDDRNAELYEAGKLAAIAALPEIKQRLLEAGVSLKGKN